MINTPTCSVPTRARRQPRQNRSWQPLPLPIDVRLTANVDLPALAGDDPHHDLDAHLVEPAALPLVEPLETFVARPRLPGPVLDLSRVARSLPARVSHRRWQTNLDVSQGARGSRRAFGGIAVLEALHARKGINVDLSEQYLFHVSKAHENHISGPGIHSLARLPGKR